MLYIVVLRVPERTLVEADGQGGRAFNPPSELFAVLFKDFLQGFGVVLAELLE